MDETICIKALLKEAAMSEDRIQKIENQARDLVHQVRQYRLKSGGKV
jgi:proline dehydrogenase